MQSAPLRRDEAAALAALNLLQVLDSEAEPEFDALVQAASAVCQAPVSLISLIDAERQWFKSSFGLPGLAETPREIAFCAHAVLGDGILEVPDATLDSRFADNPLVLGDPGIRFYAGAPLQDSQGHKLGTLCVIDRQPRQLSAAQRQALLCIASAVMAALERHRQVHGAQAAMQAVAQAALVQQYSPDAIVGFDRDGAIVRWNRAAEQLFGYTAQAVTGCLARMLLSPSEQANVFRDGTAQDLQAPQTFDVVCESAAGEPLPVAVTWVPAPNIGDQPAGATAFIRDLRPQQLATRRLAASEARFRALSNSSPLGVFHVDHDGACTYTNRRWQQIYGLGPDQALGSGWAANVSAGDRGKIGAAWRHAVLTQSELAIEYAVRRPDGSLRQVQARARPVADDEDGAPGFVGTIEDITERCEMQARLAENDELLRRLYEATPAMLHSMDDQGHLLTVSDAWLGRLGFQRSEVIGRPMTDFMTAESRELASGQLLRKLFDTGRCDAMPCAMRHRDGTVVEVLASAILDRRPGQPLRSLAVLEDVTLRRQAERQLDEQRRRLDNILQATRVGIWEWNIATGEIHVNDRSAALIGQTAESLAGQSIGVRVEVTHPDDRERATRAMQRHFAGETDFYEVDTRVRHRDGPWVWIESRGRVMSRTPEGKPGWMFGTHLDISARKALEREVQDKERFLRQVLDNVPALIAHLDTDGRYTMVNQAYRTWSKRSDAEVIGHTVAEVHGAPGQAAMATWLTAALAGTPTTFEVDLPRGSELRALQVTYVPDRDDQGRVVGVFSMKIDITPLRRTEQRLRVVMESSPLGMFVADAQGRCRFTNAAWQRIAGMDGQQCLGTGWVQAIHPEDRERMAAKWADALRTGSANEHRYRRPDGSVVWVRGYVAPVLDDRYDVGVVGTVEDITDRRRLDQALALSTAELKRSNEDLERFAYVASHDLQEPLRMVTSYGQLLVRRHRASLPAEAQEFLDFMVDGGQRAQALIRDLLSLARIDSQARPWEPVAIDALLADTVQQLRMRVRETGAEVTHGPLPVVVADARQMGQLFANLIANALKFRGSQAPRVHVSAERSGNGWRIEVRDNGLGIETRFFERIFVMFQRLHLRSEHEGTGIGLAICRKIVERHGGQIGLESVPGQGSTFYFTLPDAGVAQPLSRLLTEARTVL